MIRAATQDDLSFLCSQIGYVPTQNIKGITQETGGRPTLIVGFDGWTDNAVVMHQWCEHPRYFTRSMLRESFRYAFATCNREVAIGIVRSDNPEALAVDQKIGFRQAAVIADAYGPGIDMHILQLRRDECRWYKHDA